MSAEKLWRCSCGGSHFVSVRLLDDSEAWDTPKYVGIYVEEYPEAGHWQRIKAAWNLLRNRRHTWIEIMLTKDQAQDIAEEIRMNMEKIS